MKKYILPLVAVMIISAAANAQTTQKQTPTKTVAAAKPKSTTKPMSSTEAVTAPKTKTTAPANKVAIHKKHRHHKAKKAAKK